MRKLVLLLDDVAVETFSIEPETTRGGTVMGNQSGADTCASCVHDLCWQSRIQTNCCTRTFDASCSLPAAC